MEIKYNNCLFCGKTFEQNKKGRKKDYCSSQCQLTNKSYQYFIDNIIEIKFDEDKLKMLKGDLFALVSSLHTSVRFPRSRFVAEFIKICGDRKELLNGIDLTNEIDIGMYFALVKGDYQSRNLITKEHMKQWELTQTEVQAVKSIGRINK